MNKRLFIIWATGFVSIIAFVYVAFAAGSLKVSLTTIDLMVTELVELEGKAIGAAIRDDVLNGNYRQAEITFERFRSSGHLIGLIFEPENDQPIVIPETLVVPSKSITIRERISFSGDGPSWGNIAFIFDNGVADVLKNNVLNYFFWSLVFLFVVAILSLTFLVMFLWRVTEALLKSFEESIKNAETTFVSAAGPMRIWEPTMVQARSIGRTYRQFRDSLEDFRTKEASFRIIKQVAHDLRSPLSAIKIALSKMKNTNEMAVEIASKAVLRSEIIIEESLGTWKVESQESLRSTEDNLSFNPLDCVKEAVAELSSRYPSSNITANLSEESSIEVSGKSGDLLRVLINIMSNGLQAQMDKSTRERLFIHVGMAKLHGLCILTCHDGGPGFSAEALRYSFKEGFTEKLSSLGAGTGLGLSDAKERLRVMGATIGIANHPVGGAIVSISLPILH